MVVALTGGIACGKSTAAEVFRNLGVPIVDADAISHALTAPGGKALPTYRAAFGDQVFQPDGTLNRSALRRLIFEQPGEREKINAIMHPIIRQEMQAQIRQLEAQGHAMILLDVPLLFESGMEKMADKVICMTLPRDRQIERIMQRDHCDRQQACAIIGAQMPSAEKAARSDYAVDSDRPQEETAAIIRSIYRNLSEAQHGTNQ